MNCYYCEVPTEKHSKRGLQLCLEQVCRIIRDKAQLPYDDADSTRHPKDIVESCIKDHDLGN